MKSREELLKQSFYLNKELSLIVFYANNAYEFEELAYSQKNIYKVEPNKYSFPNWFLVYTSENYIELYDFDKDVPYNSTEIISDICLLDLDYYSDKINHIRKYYGLDY